MNEGIHLDLDTWIVPGQIRKGNLCRGLGNRYTPAGTEALISAVAHNPPPPFQAAQNATTVNTRSSVAPCTAQRHTPASPQCHPGVKRIGTSHRDFVLKGPVLPLPLLLLYIWGKVRFSCHKGLFWPRRRVAPHNCTFQPYALNLHQSTLCPTVHPMPYSPPVHPVP